MSKILSIVILLAVSGQVYSNDVSRPAQSRQSFSSNEASQGEIAKIGARKISDQISKKYSYIEVKGSPKEPLAAVVVAAVHIDENGKVLSIDIFREAKIHPIFNKKAREMIEGAAPYTQAEAGKFVVTLLFEDGGNFKMRIHD